jgi:hypothetical protein
MISSYAASLPTIDKNPFTIRPLDEKSLKFSQKELNEEPKRRQEDCELLRTWIRQQPYLRSIESNWIESSGGSNKLYLP